jgi:hypothetical protein
MGCALPQLNSFGYSFFSFSRSTCTAILDRAFHAFIFPKFDFFSSDCGFWFFFCSGPSWLWWVRSRGALWLGFRTFHALIFPKFDFLRRVLRVTSRSPWIWISIFHGTLPSRRSS